MKSFIPKKWLRDKRHFFLLEVLIGLALVALCILPLIFPYAMISLEEKRFTKEVEVDRLMGLFHVERLEQLYRNEYSWEEITEGIERPIESKELAQLGYKGWWTLRHSSVQKGKESSSGHLLDLCLFCAPLKTSSNKSKVREYVFKIYVNREVPKAEGEKK